jgi:hypothetical protein
MNSVDDRAAAIVLAPHLFLGDVSAKSLTLPLSRFSPSVENRPFRVCGRAIYSTAI